ncbi:hypothetical protein SETIT_7G265700v2 [Setaria italica]|uniref:E3 ubiquitin-protein ligase Sina-like RING finger domain-containing protein n=1 Tax=Setaria italica TaxID=4555 RepID=K3YE97_SETIT|nr:hypothetical protein SETIT_7G265700v2 [Setaria italica]
MTVDRTDALDCGICFLPLKPPIFQCDVGHVVCSPCRDKLAAGGQCHVPAVPGHGEDIWWTPSASRARTPSTAAPTGRRSTTGSTTPASARARGAAAAPGWPCTAEPTPDRSFDVHLRDGFNLITAARGEAQHLILLNVARTPFGRAVSAVRGFLREHFQTSRVEVASMDGSDALPDRSASFQFFFPKFAGGSDEDDLRVDVVINISPS